MKDETELHDAVAEMKANAPSPNASSRLYLRAVATIKLADLRAYQQRVRAEDAARKLKESGTR